MAKRQPNIIERAMRNHLLVLFFVSVIVLLGFWALPRLNKNEFPDVTIRTGVVAVIYPGATSDEIEEQVAGKVEQYLFTFSDVDKSKTYSYSKDGILYIFTNLVASTKDAPVTWSRIREGLTLFRVTDLPQGVLATAVIDDFGNASSLLLAIESPQRSSRELREYADGLSSFLRNIPEMGNIKITGEQKEEIAVHIDPVKMTQYAISPSFISTELAAHGFRTISGRVDNPDSRALVHVSIPYNNIYDLQEMVVFADPITGQTIRLRDVATIERRYIENTKYVTYADCTGEQVEDIPCLILSMEMRPGNNIVAFGDKVEKQIQAYLATIPPDVQIHRITDQPKNVNRSVLSFMKDLVEAVLVVILVMLLLFPLRTALVSSTSVPVCIAVAFAIMYFFGIELNTVTLAALIVVLGMIVDDSVVVIDGYTDMLQEGHSRWYSAAVSTKALMGSMFISTCSISGMFFPMIPVMSGSPLGDFIRLFPWAIFITLTCSFFYAIWVIPFMSYHMIKPRRSTQKSWIEKLQAGFFGWLQKGYGKLLTYCFAHKWGTVTMAFVMTLLGVFLFTKLNIQLLPKAERDSFAVEIHLTASSDVRETAAIADSVLRMLQTDPRITSITSFKGQSSPRFHITYAPQLADDAYAQFIVNTISDEATKAIFSEYPQRYDNMFPEAQIRFKQMDYQAIAAPVEIYLKAETYEQMEAVKDSLIGYMRCNPNLYYVHSDYDETTEIVDVQLDTDEANRLGITQAMLSVYLSGALSGSQLSSTWEGDYNVPICIYTEGVNDVSLEEIGDLLIPCAQPGMWVPLRQIATIEPRFHHETKPHRNGVRCITIAADVVNGAGQLREYKKVAAYLESLEKAGVVPEGVYWEPGGIKALTDANMPPTILAVLAAVLVMFMVLVIHYGEIGISLLTISQSLICLFGTTFGLWLFGLDFSVTAILGLVSLIGIIVRNGIIMYDYAGELREKQHLSAHDAAYEAGLRRMRPIFLTSATTALGVVPMIMAGTLLWEPMGVVICFGTLLTLPMVITLLPVTYCLVFDRNERRKQRLKKIDDGFQRGLEAHEKRIEDYNMRHDNPAANKTMQVLLPLVVMLSLAAPAVAQTEGTMQPLTLDSCLSMARQRNCTIRTAQMDVEKARQVKKQMFTKFFPQISGSFMGYHGFHHLLALNPKDGDVQSMIGELLIDAEGNKIADELGLMKAGLSVGATAIQPVFAGGRIVNANRYAKVGIEAAEQKAELTEREVLEEVQSTYLLVMGLQEKVATVDAAMALLDSLDKVVVVGKKAGVLEPTDALKLELKKNEMRAKQLQLTNGIRLASRLLCLQVGMDYPEEGLLLAPVADVKKSREAVERPEYKLLQLNVQSEEFKKKLTLGETLPEIGFGVNAHYGNLVSNGSLMKVFMDVDGTYRGNGLVFVSAKIPLTGWWETAHRLKQHNIAIEQAKMQQTDLTNKLRLQEEKTQAELLEAEALMQSDSAALNMAKENYRLAELNYRAGFETLTNVLEANALLLQAQNALTDRRITYLVAKRRLYDIGGQ